MALSTPFTCPNNHSFTANAKLRARCPECGAMSRKSFSSAPPKPDPEIKPDPPESTEKEPIPEPEPEKKIQVLRRGRPTMKKEKSMPHPKKKTTVTLKKKGLVSHRSVKRSVVPSVSGKPTGNREHKVAATMGEDKPYWQQVSDKYWG